MLTSINHRNPPTGNIADNVVGFARALRAAGLPFVSAGAPVIRAFSFRFRKLALSSSASREARAAAAAWACVGFSPVSVMASLNQKRCETPSA